MDETDSTCWTMIREAAQGDARGREQFALLYMPVIHAYLHARWRQSPLLQDLDDATQEVFVQCFRQGGALAKVKPDGGPGGFRAFLHAVVQNVAGRLELKHARSHEQAEGSLLDREVFSEGGESLSEVFDRAWMMALLNHAVARQEEVARQKGTDAIRRVELLRLRFNEDLPIREIARRWNLDAARLHHEYARARTEFVASFKEVLAFHHPSDPQAVEREFMQVLQRLR